MPGSNTMPNRINPFRLPDGDPFVPHKGIPLPENPFDKRWPHKRLPGEEPYNPIPNKIPSLRLPPFANAEGIWYSSAETKYGGLGNNSMDNIENTIDSWKKNESGLYIPNH